MAIERINVGIIGSGGREHAFAWKLSQSELLDQLFLFPGNGGTSFLGENITVDPLDFQAISECCLNNNIKLLIVGPEAPLVEGIVDYFETNESLKHIVIVGPNKSAAQLEGSKDYSKLFMQRNGIPTARSKTFVAENANEISSWLNELQAPYVVKADGLASGKGVIICSSIEDALKESRSMIFEGKFASAGAKVVIEEFLEGIEVSVFAFSDGNSFIILPEAKDYKRIGEGDTGLNTGGMGAVSPVSFFHGEFKNKVIMQIVQPTFKALKKEGVEYKGFLFFGLINVKGEPFVIEYNARMGDPETETILPIIESDLIPLFLSIKDKTLHYFELQCSSKFSTSIVGVAKGYPEHYQKGDLIDVKSGIEGLVFHAGTQRKESGELVTSGGRVIVFTGLGDTPKMALENSKQLSSKVNWNGKYQRNDIGNDLFKD